MQNPQSYKSWLYEELCIIKAALNFDKIALYFQIEMSNLSMSLFHVCKRLTASRKYKCWIFSQGEWFA